MGLLSRIDSIQPSLNLQSTATKSCCTFSNLQSDNKNLFEYPFKHLHNFCNSCAVAHFAFFLPYNNKYFLIFNHGYSFNTTLQATCNFNFWHNATNCQLEENTWYTQETPNFDSILQLFAIEDRENIKVLHLKSVNIGEYKNCIIITSQKEINFALSDYILDQIDENFDFFSNNLQKIAQNFYDAKLVLQKNEQFYEDDILEKCANNLTCLMLKVNLKTFYDEICIHNTKTDAMLLQESLLKIFNDNLAENYFYIKKDFSLFNYLIFSNKKFNFSSFLNKFSSEVEKYFNKSELDKIKFELNGFSKDCDEIMNFVNDTRRQVWTKHFLTPKTVNFLVK